MLRGPIRGCHGGLTTSQRPDSTEEAWPELAWRLCSADHESGNPIQTADVSGGQLPESVGVPRRARSTRFRRSIGLLRVDLQEGQVAQ